MAAPATQPPQAPASRSASLYVGDLPIDLPNPEDALYNMFNKIGMVMSIKVCRDINTQRSLGYAYVNYQNPQDAEQAIESLNYAEIRPGRPIRIMWSSRDPSSRKNASGNIFVKNLHKSLDTRGLRDIFAVFGNILSCKLATDETGASRGYGFVHFEKEESANDAIARVNGMKIEGNDVQVTKFVKKADRQAEQEKVFTTVYVKNIKKDAAEESVKSLFVPFGIVSIFVAAHPNFPTKYAIVQLKGHEEAKEAIEKLHDKSFADVTEGDAKLFVTQALKKRDRIALKQTPATLFQNQSRNIYVKHIDDDITKEQFEDLFKQFGAITSSAIMKDEKGNARGFGFVCFEAKESAQAAIHEMNGKMIFKRPLYVSLAQQKDSRTQMLQEQRKAIALQQQQRMMPPQNMQYNPFWQQPPFMRPAVAMLNPSMPPNQFMRGPGMGRGQGIQRGGMVQRPPQQFAAKMMMPQYQQQMRQTYTQPAVMPPQRSSGLTPEMLAKMTPEEAKNALGERLYVKVQTINPELAAKITGMLLEIDMNEVLNVLDDPTLLRSKVNEAMTVLKQHNANMQ